MIRQNKNTRLRIHNILIFKPISLGSISFHSYLLTYLRVGFLIHPLHSWTDLSKS